MSDRVAALSALVAALRERDYRFITPTPATHARVLARRGDGVARDLRDVFGWSMPFGPDTIDASLVSLLRAAEMLDESSADLRSRVRVSSLDDDLFLHSAFPTTGQDAVFFGPDSYRFARFLNQTLPYLPPRTRLVDIGTGTGVGGLVAARLTGAHAVLADINPRALEFARANWTVGDAEFIESDALSELSGDVDLIIANPPYIADPAHRAYRDGGAMHGAALSVRWASEAAARLKTGGAFVLYTGSAIVGGEDALRTALTETLHEFDVLYGELDPDVFSEELERADYADVDRIAVVGVVAIKK